MSFALPANMMTQMSKTLESKTPKKPAKTEKELKKLKFLKSVRSLNLDLTQSLHSTDALLTMIDNGQNPSWSELGLTAKQGEEYKKHLMAAGKALVALLKVEKEFPTLKQSWMAMEGEMQGQEHHHHSHHPHH